MANLPGRISRYGANSSAAVPGVDGASDTAVVFVVLPVVLRPVLFDGVSYFAGSLHSGVGQGVLVGHGAVLPVAAVTGGAA